MHHIFVSSRESHLLVNTAASETSALVQPRSGAKTLRRGQTCARPVLRAPSQQPTGPRPRIEAAPGRPPRGTWPLPGRCLWDVLWGTSARRAGCSRNGSASGTAAARETAADRPLQPTSWESHNEHARRRAVNCAALRGTGCLLRLVRCDGSFSWTRILARTAECVKVCL